MDLTKFPRRKYTPYETPIEPMPRLSATVGQDVNLWIKRDDMLGLTGGGNKTRKLEFVMADALQKGADTVITCGAVQSNHCRLTLSACVKEGLRCCLVIEERVPESYQESASGNNYLFHLLGVERIVKVGPGEAPAMMQKLAKELEEKEGRNVYICPGGASNEIGAMGYCSCAQELQVSEIFPLRICIGVDQLQRIWILKYLMLYDCCSIKCTGTSCLVLMRLSQLRVVGVLILAWWRV